MAVKEKNQISSSVRALYRIIGRIIGKQIFDRIANDHHIDPSAEVRRTLAQEVISSITAYRKELGTDRDLHKLKNLMSELFNEKKDRDISIKQLSWILEAYLLLNQSSTASALVTKPSSNMPDSLLMSRLIEKIRTRILREEKLAKVFTKDFSMNLVLTAHPTAGIQPDYIHHIKNLVKSIQTIAYQIDPKDWDKISHDHTNESLESNIAEIIEDINLSISHMVRAQPYNKERLTPSIESNNFLDNTSAAWNIIPAKVISLEKELRKYLGKDFRIHPRFFRVHSWVARDIDGNPTVSAEEHLKSIHNEKIFFLSQYRKDLETLWQNLSDDFTKDPKLPTKTFFVNKEFEDYSKEVSDQFSNEINYHNKAYRVVIYKIIVEIDHILNKHLFIEELNFANLKAISDYDLNEIIVKPLEMIRANKESTLVQEIDDLIRKVQIFGSFGSHGHTRQGASILALMTKYLCAFWDNQAEPKTNYVLKEDKSKIQYPVLKNKITLQYKKDNPKTQHKLMQTFDLLELSELGSIKRQIISMNESFEDMLNALCIAKAFGAFTPSTDDKLPWSRLEIVALTEQIIDLRNSYQVTIEALTNQAWHEYLIANQGRFYKMRGPSDSGKQNGFIASQWEMFRSKQFDTIVVEIFNAYLLVELEQDDRELRTWLNLLEKSKDSDMTKDEIMVIEKSINSFKEFFSSKEFNLDLWKRAQKELELKKVRLINFDGWGEPVERGGGLEFEDTVKFTQPMGSLPYYERTLQGGGAQQLNSGLRTKQAIQDFLNGVTEIAVRRFALNKNYDPELLCLDPNFVYTMQKFVKILRSALRSEVFGLDLEDDSLVENEEILRRYFRHVIKSPLVFLDLFNIASRPTSRSGSQIKEYLNQDQYSNNIDLMIEKLPKEDIIAILSDVRAIPYAAMFSLLGGNHVSFYGYDKVLEDTEKYSFKKGQTKKTLVEWLKYFYHAKSDRQESMLIRHIIDSVERGIFTADQECYRQAHQMIEEATDPNYKSGNDILLLNLIQAQQDTLNFVAEIKKYKVANPKKVTHRDLMQDNEQERDLLLARRDDAAVPRIGLARSISEIFLYCKEKDLNPLEEGNLPDNLVDLLRKAFAAGASTFGNGCID